MNLASTNDVSECELLEAIGRVILESAEGSESVSGFVDSNTFLVGILTSIPLSSQERRAFWGKRRTHQGVSQRIQRV